MRLQVVNEGATHSLTHSLTHSTPLHSTPSDLMPRLYGGDPDDAQVSPSGYRAGIGAGYHQIQLKERHIMELQHEMEDLKADLGILRQAYEATLVVVGRPHTTSPS